MRGDDGDSRSGQALSTCSDSGGLCIHRQRAHVSCPAFPATWHENKRLFDNAVFTYVYVAGLNEKIFARHATMRSGVFTLPERSAGLVSGLSGTGNGSKRGLGQSLYFLLQKSIRQVVSRRSNV